MRLQYEKSRVCPGIHRVRVRPATRRKYLRYILRNYLAYVNEADKLNRNVDWNKMCSSSLPTHNIGYCEEWNSQFLSIMRGYQISQNSGCILSVWEWCVVDSAGLWVSRLLNRGCIDLCLIRIDLCLLQENCLHNSYFIILDFINVADCARLV